MISAKVSKKYQICQLEFCGKVQLNKYRIFLFHGKMQPLKIQRFGCDYLTDTASKKSWSKLVQNIYCDICDTVCQYGIIILTTIKLFEGK